MLSLEYPTIFFQKNAQIFSLKNSNLMVMLMQVALHNSKMHSGIIQAGGFSVSPPFVLFGWLRLALVWRVHRQ